MDHIVNRLEYYPYTSPTMCPRSSYPFYHGTYMTNTTSKCHAFFTVSYYIKWVTTKDNTVLSLVTTSWTYSTDQRLFIVL